MRPKSKSRPARPPSKSLGDLLSDLLTETYPVAAEHQQAPARGRPDRRGRQTVAGASDVADLPRRSKSRPERLQVDQCDHREGLPAACAMRTGRRSSQQSSSASRDLEAAVLGADGFLASQREALAASSELAAGRETLDRIEAIYVGMLDEVRRAVSSLNHDARDEMHERHCRKPGPSSPAASCSRCWRPGFRPASSPTGSPAR